MRRGAPVKVWCGRRDSNPHDFHHRNLNPARLPVPPRPPRARHSPRGLQRVRLYSNRGGSLHEKTAAIIMNAQKPLALGARSSRAKIPRIRILACTRDVRRNVATPLRHRFAEREFWPAPVATPQILASRGLVPFRSRRTTHTRDLPKIRPCRARIRRAGRSPRCASHILRACSRAAVRPAAAAGHRGRWEAARH
jgi:hypothetical protein